MLAVEIKSVSEVGWCGVDIGNTELPRCTAIKKPHILTEIGEQFLNEKPGRANLQEFLSYQIGCFEIGVTKLRFCCAGNFIGY
ncbi:MAG: hypothetical protein M0R33_05670 [Methylomonas sp.]|jgi:hypothetical protein|uniref:hypothetical protein n=1 Tax=Methylomonas sp. TaxID=418 RepID=UPI0025FE62CB|nr:hypothetical protein [Methylomonas sp.]MCK9605923.1 hypothetical protein [Methylomonas sp.]